MLSKLDAKRKISEISLFAENNDNVLVYDLVPVGLDLVFGDILKFFSRNRQEKRR